MERREFLKLTLGFTAAAGSIAAIATSAVQAAPMLPLTGMPPPEVKPAETAMQGKAEPAVQTDPNAAATDDTDMWARHRRRFWRRRRRWWPHRRRRFFRRRRVIYY